MQCIKEARGKRDESMINSYLYKSMIKSYLLIYLRISTV